MYDSFDNTYQVLSFNLLIHLVAAVAYNARDMVAREPHIMSPVDKCWNIIVIMHFVLF